MQQLLFLSLVGGLFSLTGGILLLWRPKFTHRYLTTLLSFGAGAFLAAVFLDILPEALEMTDEPHPILLATLFGFLAFFILERLIMRHLHIAPDHAEHSEHTESLAPLLILGDSIHNLLDGVVIALAFAANPALGLPTALAIAAHEIPQEIGDFSVLIKLKWPRWRIIAVNVAQSLLTIPGVLIGTYIGHAVTGILPQLLGATAGIFLYIAASDLIPELHHQSGHRHFLRVILPMLVSIGLIWKLTMLAHG